MEMTSVLHLRVRPELDAALKARASQLGLRPADLMRVLLAQVLTDRPIIQLEALPAGEVQHDHTV